MDITKTGLFTDANQSGTPTLLIVFPLISSGRFITLIDKTHIIAPTTKDPESPINNRAGEKLNTKNPTKAPHNTKANNANGISPQNKKTKPKKTRNNDPYTSCKPIYSIN